MPDNQKITIRGTSSGAIIDGLEGNRPVKIPSQFYPLTGPAELISAENTLPFPASEESTVRKVFDSITPGIGMCYENTNKLIMALTAEGIKATPYVGWIITLGARPVHHCFTVVGQSILDFLIKPSILYAEAEQNDVGDITKARELVVSRFMELRNAPNSVKATFGQVDPKCFYIACPCKPDEGRKRFQKLMKAYPKHPSYTNIYANGSNMTQTMLTERLSQNK